MNNTATKAQFSPGPWKVGTDADDNAIWIEPARSSDNVICDIMGRTVGHVTVEDKANANLIAAAPEMYEALKAEQFALELASVDDPQSRTRLLESVGDYESGWALNWAIVVEKYHVKAALLRDAAIAKAEGHQ